MCFSEHQTFGDYRRHVRLASKIHRAWDLSGSIDSPFPAVYEGYVWVVVREPGPTPYPARLLQSPIGRHVLRAWMVGSWFPWCPCSLLFWIFHVGKGVQDWCLSCTLHHEGIESSVLCLMIPRFLGTSCSHNRSQTHSIPFLHLRATLKVFHFQGKEPDHSRIITSHFCLTFWPGARQKRSQGSSGMFFIRLL